MSLNFTDDYSKKGSFRIMASSREAENDSSMKMHRYIRLDFVGFFFDWSSKMRMANRNLEWKSSRMVKSSKACFRVRACTYRVGRQESPGEDANLLNERDLVDTIRQIRSLGVNHVLEVLRKTCV